VCRIFFRGLVISRFNQSDMLTRGSEITRNTTLNSVHDDFDA